MQLPVLVGRPIPVTVRLGLCVCLATLLAGVVPGATVPTSVWGLVTACGGEVRFSNRTGHSLRSVWFVSYDGPEAYGIRIGHGRQPEPIENVRIFGKGTIDLNASNNALPSGLVKNINACVLIHGRVRKVVVRDGRMTRIRLAPPWQR